MPTAEVALLLAITGLFAEVFDLTIRLTYYLNN